MAYNRNKQERVIKWGTSLTETLGMIQWLRTTVNIRNSRTFKYMKPRPFTVQKQVVIVRQYKNIGITAKLQAFHLPTLQELPPHFYNGRIAYQYKNLRVGLTSLRKQPRCRILLSIPVPVLPF